MPDTLHTHTMPAPALPVPPSPTDIDRFQDRLLAEGYAGDTATDLGTRAVMATDNSVYECLPAAVLFPKRADDLNCIMRAAVETGIAIVARGGGTGTNGQSLTDSVIVDCSRYLNRIERIDPEAGIAVAQPGVILDELNRAAAEHGLFFAPTVSTASRATLGGMAATDASGKGSRIYGRTSDHVLNMEVALGNGETWQTEALDPEALNTICTQDDLPGQLHRLLRDVADDEREEIERVYPAMNRGLTGYNLRQLYDASGHFHLEKLLCGSEGSLALTRRLTLRLLKKPTHRALMVVGYDDPMSALSDVGRLAGAEPAAVEFIDDHILRLAKDDPIWADIRDVLDAPVGVQIGGLNFVEVQADSEASLDIVLARLNALPQATETVVSRCLVRDPFVIAQLWSLRSRCVGLLGRMDPTRQGTAFVEDAAVPPEALPAFVAGFREILDAHGLSYGMFGHADVGCLHVRPALDMRRPGDAAKLRPVSDAVEALARRHGGLIWGEHGKGVRGEYGPLVFGERLYARMCQIKAAFDPANLLNPGKIATPSPDEPLLAVDGVPFRGARDATIPAHLNEDFEKAVKCNGNGQCFGQDAFDAMCPSYKATGDRRQSPKGRAAMLRIWARGGADAEEIAPELHRSLETCLACKACASQCPVKVDIPQMRSRFLDEWHQNNRRPLRHHLLGLMETFAPVMRRLPLVTNTALSLAAPIMERIGLVHLPYVDPARRTTRSRTGRPGVILLEDTFTATWDGRVIEAASRLLDTLGYDVTRESASPNGKALHHLGRLRAFRRVARKALVRERALVGRGLPIIALEPAVLCLWRDEYRALRGADSPIQSLDQFLSREISRGALPELKSAEPNVYRLFPHCTENTSDPESAGRWSAIFSHFGLRLEGERTGCCGMAGTFGHERKNQEISEKLFDMSWAPRLKERDKGTPLATGFSCRCQTERLAGERPDHPVEALARQLVNG
ncbi:FAD-binding and (Fe-S)-binding domain-containing protein [Phaeobacter sp. 22II1-1F12B]|uniref:FAD-binding and (Fe-S)-binding domain-containing protein n=1 Tax=Phaeobacter sp. 22II1-1F12B TaxID=1317111 RepID=UPI001302F31C|nr:FAD-binding and (Fe-S)-binding domain-containing protein [Phaeobacter sp. 22II1-1F12B]